MAYELLSNRNVELGLQVILIYINDMLNGWFINGFLLMIWFSVAFGLFFFQLRTKAGGDFPVCVAVAGFVTSITAILLRLVTDENGNHPLVSLNTLGVVFVITFIGIIWLWFSKR